MNPNLLKSKFVGSMLGTSVGDALDMSIEGLHDVGEDILRAIADGDEPLIYTDDTHMMIGVAESLIECNGFDGEHMAKTFIRNYDREPLRGYGPGPPNVFKLMKAGRPKKDADQELYVGGSFGNGSAMRIAPIGIFYHDNLEEMLKIACESSRITHSHQLGLEGAMLQATSISLATRANPSTLDVEKFLTELEGFVDTHVYRLKLKCIRRLLAVEADTKRVAFELGNGIEAFNSVPTALYCFLLHPNSLKDAILYALSLGGDVDTIAAMTGAMAGAYLGFESIPNRWKMRLENREYIEALARRLCHVKMEKKAE